MKGTLRFFYDHWFVSYMEENSHSTFGGHQTTIERFCSFILVDKKSLISHKDILSEGYEVNFNIQQNLDDEFFKVIKNYSIFGLKSEYTAILYTEKKSWDEIYEEYNEFKNINVTFQEWLDKNYEIPRKK